MLEERATGRSAADSGRGPTGALVALAARGIGRLTTSREERVTLEARGRGSLLDVAPAGLSGNTFEIDAMSSKHQN